METLKNSLYGISHKLNLAPSQGGGTNICIVASGHKTHLGCRSESNQRLSTPVLFLGASSLKHEKAIESSFPAKNWPKTTFSGLTPPRVKGLGPMSASINTLASTNYHINISPKALLL